jgi:hypothetical protein
MSSRIVNIFGLLIVAGVITSLAVRPQLVRDFFSGSNRLLQTALSGGQR